MQTKTKPTSKPEVEPKNTTVQHRAVLPEGLRTAQWLPSWDLNVIMVIAVLFALILYGNTVLNKYAVDDTMVILKNSYVQKGFAGIKDILTNDSERAWKESVSGLKVEKDKTKFGYWRPLSYVTFAVEWQLFGENPYISHGLNVILYALTAALLAFVLGRYLFYGANGLVLLTTLIYIAHPIHTEVVANIKGRDEILALLFLLATMGFTFHALFNPKDSLKAQGLAVLCFFLALLAKENGLVFLGVIPLSIFFFTDAKIAKIVRHTLPFLIVAFVYLIIRYKITGLGTQSEHDDLLYNRFVKSNFNEKYATIIVILGKYLSLLFFPHPLSWDYTFAEIPFYSFRDSIVWVWGAVNIGLLGWALWQLSKRNCIAYGILLYYGCIFIVSNILVDIGGYVGERFLYQSSLGFAIALSGLLLYVGSSLIPKMPFIKWGLQVVVVFSLLLCSYKTITRNRDWSDNDRLFLQDVKSSPNSAKTHSAVGEIYAKRAEMVKDSAEKIKFDTTKKAEYEAMKARYFKIFDTSLTYYKHSLSIYPDYFDALLNVGEIYFLMDSLEVTEYWWERAYKLQPFHHKMVKYRIIEAVHTFWRGRHAANYRRFDEAKSWLRRSVYYDSSSDSAIYMLAMCHAMTNMPDSASYYLRKASALAPRNTTYLHDLAVALSQQGKNSEARVALQTALALEPQNERYKAFYQRLGN